MVGRCGRGDEPLGSVNDRECLDKSRDYQLLVVFSKKSPLDGVSCKVGFSNLFVSWDVLYFN